MFRVEIKELGEGKQSICKTVKEIDYKDLYNLVSPYLTSEHLSFSLPNDCTDGSEWGYIYSGENHVGQIRITDLEETSYTTI